ncbi:MAG: hypothetical protein ACFCGT_05815 [Sandaracinaceae bacterium]
MASRVVPPRWPFRVDTIRYLVSGDRSLVESCDASVPQTVHVFASPTVPPPEDPEVDETLVVRGLEPRIPTQTVEVDLATPLVLEQDEFLYVAVTLARSGEDSPCRVGCLGGVPVRDDYIAFQGAPPFSWRVDRYEGEDARSFVAALGELL